MNWLDCPGIEQIPGKYGGKPLIKNTRIPVEAIIQNYEGGSTVEQILEYYPGASRDIVERIIAFYNAHEAELS